MFDLKKPITLENPRRGKEQFGSQHHKTCPPDLRSDGRRHGANADDARNQGAHSTRLHTGVCGHRIEGTRYGL